MSSSSSSSSPSVGWTHLLLGAGDTRISEGTLLIPAIHILDRYHDTQSCNPWCDGDMQKVEHSNQFLETCIKSIYLNAIITVQVQNNFFFKYIIIFRHLPLSAHYMICILQVCIKRTDLVVLK